MYVWGRGEYTGGHSVGSADAMPLMHVLEGVAVCGHAVCVCVYVCMYVCMCVCVCVGDERPLCMLVMRGQ